MVVKDKKYLGKYYSKMVEKGNIVECEAIKKINEKKLKMFLGCKAYKEMKILGMSLKEYIFYITEEKERFKAKLKETAKKQRTREKSNIRVKENKIERICQICGKSAETHHPNYNDYNNVNFLCRKHHMQLHKGKLSNINTVCIDKYH